MIQAAIPPNIASNSKGSIPSIVVPEAIATGTILDFVASIIASSRGVPFSSSIPIWSTSTIAFLIFIPINPSTPRIAKKSSIFPVTANPKTTPIKIRGTINKMIVGLR